MKPIKIFGFAGSTYVRTALMVCAEKGVSYELVPLEFQADSHRARHPFLKMPALQHDDGVALFETLAIATYVDGLRATPALQPSDVAAGATMMQWISVAIDYLYRDLVGALLSETPPERASEKAARDLDVLDDALSKSAFLAGPSVTLADLFVAPMVDFAAKKGGVFAPAGRASLKRWLDTMADRKSFKSTAA